MSRKDHLRAAAEAHTDMNIFESIKILLDGGVVHSWSERTLRAIERITAICQREQQALLREYEAAAAAISTGGRANG